MKSARIKPVKLFGMSIYKYSIKSTKKAQP